MIKKFFLQAFIVFLVISFPGKASYLEEDKTVAHPRFFDAWYHIASVLNDEKDVARLSCVCRLTDAVGQIPAAWTGVAQKYQIKPHQARRFLNLLSTVKGQEEIEFDRYALFFFLKHSYVEQYLYKKASSEQPLLDFNLLLSPKCYMRVLDYVRLKIEEEDLRQKSIDLKVASIFELQDFKLPLLELPSFELVFEPLQDEAQIDSNSEPSKSSPD